MALEGASVDGDAAALEAAASDGSVVATACRSLEVGEAAASVFLVAHLDWRWDAAPLFDDGGGGGGCETIALARQPPKFAELLRRVGGVQFPAGGCARARSNRHHSGTYLGNRVDAMAHKFAEHTLRKRKKERFRVPYVNWGLPEYLLDDAACGGSGNREKDLECFFLPSSSCGRPRGADGGLVHGDCVRNGTAWACKDLLPLSFQDKMRGVEHFPDPCVPSHLAVAFLAVAFRPNARTRLTLRRRTRAWLAENPGWRSTRADGACAAVHVRHGDKYTAAFSPENFDYGRHRPPNASLGDYVDAALAHLPALGVAAGGARLLLLTDDADVAGAAAGVAAEKSAEIFSVAPGRPLVSTSAVAADARLSATNCERKVASPRCATGGFNYRRDPLTGAYVGSEELYQFLLAFHLLAHCKLVVGMGKLSYFSEFIYNSACAINGACPAKVDIHSPDALADDGKCHYSDGDPLPAGPRRRTGDNVPRRPRPWDP